MLAFKCWTSVDDCAYVSISGRFGSSRPAPNEDSRTRASESSKTPQTTGRTPQPTARTPQPQDQRKMAPAEGGEAEIRTPAERKTMEASTRKEEVGGKGNGGKRVDQDCEEDTTEPLVVSMSTPPDSQTRCSQGNSCKDFTTCMNKLQHCTHSFKPHTPSFGHPFWKKKNQKGLEGGGWKKGKNFEERMRFERTEKEELSRQL